MRIITHNVNGIRAAAKYGLFDWLKTQNADVICLQEIKAHKEQLSDPVFFPSDYHHYFFSAEKKGYSGVAIYSKIKPQEIIKGLGWQLADQEGRYLQIDFANLSVISVYLPSGTSGPERQSCKFEFMEQFMPHLRSLKNASIPAILCGDWNIAHTKDDLKNWRGNQKNSGFLPEERAWLDNLFMDEGFVDAFRLLNKETDQYTWWSNRGQAYAKNVGWRIDYQIITPKLAPLVKAVSIYKEQKFSDHAPLVIDYNFIL